jgi:transcriptional regulator with XRE-family HTH domain
MSQADLAESLELSQGRISQLEHGRGSFAAEQLLLLSRLFNVPVTDFLAGAEEPSRHAQVQNALARFGASALWESDEIVPDEQLRDPATLIVEALLLGDPRHVVGLAPVLVKQLDRLSLAWIDSRLRGVGGGRRLPWVVDNTLAAIELAKQRPLRRDVANAYRRAEVVLGSYLSARAHETDSSDTPDILDRTIRTKRSLETVRAASSEQSRRWGIVSGLQPEDFASALEGTHA